MTSPTPNISKADLEGQMRELKGILLQVTSRMVEMDRAISGLVEPATANTRQGDCRNQDTVTDTEDTDCKENGDLPYEFSGLIAQRSAYVEALPDKSKKTVQMNNDGESS